MWLVELNEAVLAPIYNTLLPSFLQKICKLAMLWSSETTRRDSSSSNEDDVIRDFN